MLKRSINMTHIDTGRLNENYIYDFSNWIYQHSKKKNVGSCIERWTFGEVQCSAKFMNIWKFNKLYWNVNRIYVRVKL